MFGSAGAHLCFFRGNISIVSLLTLFSGHRSAEMPVERMQKKKRMV